jgi:hypothetical protein
MSIKPINSSESLESIAQRVLVAAPACGDHSLSTEGAQELVDAAEADGTVTDAEVTFMQELRSRSVSSDSGVFSESCPEIAADEYYASAVTTNVLDTFLLHARPTDLPAGMAVLPE